MGDQPAPTGSQGAIAGPDNSDDEKQRVHSARTGGAVGMNTGRSLGDFAGAVHGPAGATSVPVWGVEQQQRNTSPGQHAPIPVPTLVCLLHRPNQHIMASRQCQSTLEMCGQAAAAPGAATSNRQHNRRRATVATSNPNPWWQQREQSNQLACWSATLQRCLGSSIDRQRAAHLHGATLKPELTAATPGATSHRVLIAAAVVVGMCTFGVTKPAVATGI